MHVKRVMLLAISSPLKDATGSELRSWRARPLGLNCAALEISSRGGQMEALAHRLAMAGPKILSREDFLKITLPPTPLLVRIGLIAKAAAVPPPTTTNSGLLAEALR